MRILGIMSGSSLDGIDLATVVFDEADPSDWRLENSKCYSFGSQLKNRLELSLELQARGLAELEADYTDFIAECILDFQKAFPEAFSYCSVHGHTLVHDVENKFSWQMLNAGLLSSLTNKHIVTDFRNQDLGYGGLGTPMAALIDRDLFSDFDYCINLGGIANISYGEDEAYRAYDIAPCNQVHDHLAKMCSMEYDESGQLGRQGVLDERLLNELLLLAAAKKISPAIDNSWIREYWIPKLPSSTVSPQDLLRTHYEFIARHISSLCSKADSKVLLSGGGAKNQYLVELIQSNLRPSVQLHLPDPGIIDFKECILMSYMAYKRIKKELNFIKESTGAGQEVSAGAIYYCKSLD